jgi:hypothetical protein
VTSGRTAGDARRAYGIARGSALECAAVLDALETLGFRGAERLSRPRELLDRVVAMRVLPATVREVARSRPVRS